MKTLFIPALLVAAALAVLTATPPALAQSPRPTTSAGRTTITARTTPRPALQAVRPSATAASQSAPSTTTTKENTITPAAAHSQPGVRTSPAQPVKTLVSGKQKYLNAGIGLAAYYGGGLPIGASFEVDVKNNISVGGSVDYFRYGYTSGGYKWNYTFIYAGARASYHLGELLSVENSKFDPYVGATLGLRYAGYHDNTGYDNYASPYNSGLFLGIHLGSRYMFSDKIGGFAEVGYGVSALRLGVAAKF